MKRLFLVPVCLMALSAPAFAASLGASCFLPDDATSKVEGTNINKRMPIASVSKIMTAYWSSIEKGLDYRFTTKVHVTTVEKDLYDVHLEGSRDPYFGKESLHFMMAQLNKLGVTKIRDLTFDQNFKFFWINSAGDMYKISSGSWRMESPSPSLVLSQLKKQNLTNQYSATVAYAKARGIQMPAKISWSQKKISYKPSKDFQETPSTQTYRFRSSQLQTLLKEMNRNSNNHAAIQIFEHVGGADEFNPFVQRRLSFTEKDILFLEGSGNNMGSNGKSAYNEASCTAVVTVLKDYRKFLLDQDKDFKDVMAVVGGDITSTAQMYNNSKTNKAVIAKTGTVSPNVTLGGYVATQKGNYFFFYNMLTNGTVADWSKARRQIGALLTKFVASKNGGKSMSYKAVAFQSFDSASGLDIINVGTSEGLK